MKLVLACTALLLLPGHALGQQLRPVVGGAGLLGPWQAGGAVVIDTAVTPVLEVQSFTVPPCCTVRCVGPLPLVIRSQGPILIQGVLDASGLPGGSGSNDTPGGAGGQPGCGGGAGGMGGASSLFPLNPVGQDGTGLSPGSGGLPAGLVPGVQIGGGGGAGNAGAGSSGGAANNGSGLSASGSGGPALPWARSGSGGGGGAAEIDSWVFPAANDGGGGGGGGGGSLTLLSDHSITVGGVVAANGGAGGASSGNGGAGGGGSGGSVILCAPLLDIQGLVTVTGAAGGIASQPGCGCSPGGSGSHGRILLLGPTNFGAGALLLPAPIALSGAYALASPGAALVELAIDVPATWTWALAWGGYRLPPGPDGVIIDFSDPLFSLLWPVNLLPTTFVGTAGTGPGLAYLDLSWLPASVRAEVFLHAQFLTSDGTTTVASNPVSVLLVY